MSAGFAAVPNWLVEEPGISSSEKLVYLVLSSKIGDQGAWFIGHSEIAKMAGISVSSVQRALASLRERGVVTWEPRHDPQTGAQQGNSYRLMTDRLGQGDRPPRSQGPTPPVRVTDLNKNPEKEPKKDLLSAGADELSMMVETLWKLWPASRRSTRKVVTQSLRSATKTHEWADIASAAARHARVWAQWPQGDLQYIPLLSTWLNQERWTGADPEPRFSQSVKQPARKAPTGVRRNDEWMYG